MLRREENTEHKQIAYTYEQCQVMRKILGTFVSLTQNQKSENGTKIEIQLVICSMVGIFFRKAFSHVPEFRHPQNDHF